MIMKRSNSVRISRLSLDSGPDHQELSAIVDGEKIWYRFPASTIERARPEAFLAPALFEAMVRRIPVDIDPEFVVSAKLLTSIPEIQTVLHCWNPDLKVIPVNAVASDEEQRSDSAFCCFSGGIDSSYTYSKCRDAVTHLLLVQGFASGRGGPNDWEDNIAARARFAAAENKKLVSVYSNVTNFLASRDISILLSHGSVLCGLAAALGAGQLFVPATYTYRNLMPWGSHPLLDPLWSTESMAIVHHGAAATRIEKTEYVISSQSLLDQLQVCWYAGGSNCGECGKCIRTSLALFLLGAESSNLAPFRNRRQLNLLKSVDTQNLPYLNELIALAERSGQEAIASRLRWFRKSYRLRKAGGDLVKEIGGPSLRRLVRRIRPRAWHTTRGALRSANDPSNDI
jgi:hypothetical protein